MYTIGAIGGKPADDFVEMFLPSYDPERELTQDEIDAKIAAFTKRQGI
jgi:hypothetical protein